MMSKAFVVKTFCIYSCKYPECRQTDRQTNKHARTFMISILAGDNLGYLRSIGSSSLDSGNLIPMNSGFLEKISLCLAIRWPVFMMEGVCVGWWGGGGNSWQGTCPFS